MSEISADSKDTLKSVLEIMEPLTVLLIKSGISYPEFTVALKSVFYKIAENELAQQNIKITDSSLSLLSGLQRRDINFLRQSNDLNVTKTYKSSLASRVITAWGQKQLPESLAISGSKPSFESLVKEISQDVHPKSVLAELQRLDLVSIFLDEVTLNSTSFIPSNDKKLMQDVLTQNVYNHLSAGIENITKKSDSFLEHSVTANNLTLESVEELRDLSVKLWKENTEQLIDKATFLYTKDKNKDVEKQRFTIGVYQYNK